MPKCANSHHVVRWRKADSRSDFWWIDINIAKRNCLQESFYILVPAASSWRKCWYFIGQLARGRPLENVRCLRCNRELESGRKFVAIYMFAQTVGIKPRQKSAAQRIVFCPQCSVSLALGLSPEGALNVAAWDMIRDLVSSDPALNHAAWENLRGVVGLLEAGESQSEPEQRSDAWVNFSRAV